MDRTAWRAAARSGTLTGMISYKGYSGRVEYDDEHELFHGEVVNIRDVITFQGTTVKALKQAFRDSVDDYLELCAERGFRPEKPHSGKFVVRLGSEIHRSVSAAAAASNMSLNAWVTSVLEREAEQQLKGARGRTLKDAAE